MNPLVDAGRGAEDVADGQIQRLAVDARDPTTRLLDDQRTGGDVPRLEAELEEAVEAPARDVGEIERRAAEAPNALGALDEPVEQPERRLRPLTHVVRETGAEERPVQLGGVGGADRLAVESRTAASRGRERLAADRIVDHSRQQSLITLH